MLALILLEKHNFQNEADRLADVCVLESAWVGIGKALLHTINGRWSWYGHFPMAQAGRGSGS